MHDEKVVIGRGVLLYTYNKNKECHHLMASYIPKIYWSISKKKTKRFMEKLGWGILFDEMPSTIFSSKDGLIEFIMYLESHGYLKQLLRIFNLRYRSIVVDNAIDVYLIREDFNVDDISKGSSICTDEYISTLRNSIGLGYNDFFTDTNIYGHRGTTKNLLLFFGSICENVPDYLHKRDNLMKIGSGMFDLEARSKKEIRMWKELYDSVGYVIAEIKTRRKFEIKNI